ncbi:MAG: nucleoside phosphorylase [Bacteroidales bacterium]|nr:nucleoside phosphorylase [Bacteroidales bacterium]MBN2697406.1 nucleoside phosphorylase [Bacteroidales bacterium]
MSDLFNTDLLINRDGAVFHLNLNPGDIADDIILVGDPGRVKQVSDRFDEKLVIRENREFVTHTGLIGGHKISVISTGIGTDNIDIVVNELDALVNIDLRNRMIRKEHHQLNLIRLGTSGLLDPEISPGSFILSRISGGLDGTIYFYRETEPFMLDDLSERFIRHFSWNKNLSRPYFLYASEILADRFQSPSVIPGISISAPGFYGPQFRTLRLHPFIDDFLERVVRFSYNDLRISNFEMESSALYALSRSLGHEAVTLCVGIANRITNEFLDDYKVHVDRLITYVLKQLTGQDHG